MAGPTVNGERQAGSHARGPESCKASTGKASTGKIGTSQACPVARQDVLNTSPSNAGAAHTAFTKPALPANRRRRCAELATTRGFTLVELMVVMSIIALLIAIAVPRYFHSIDNAREATLKQDLSVMREAIDKYYGDHERYPPSLQELASKKYIRSIPPDPITGSSETWVLIAPEQAAETTDGSNFSAIYDVKSGAPGNAKDGSLYAEW